MDYAVTGSYVCAYCRNCTPVLAVTLPAPTEAMPAQRPAPPDAASLRAAFMALLVDIEKGYKAQDACCPICDAHPWDTNDGHYKGCRFAAMLATQPPKEPTA